MLNKVKGLPNYVSGAAAPVSIKDEALELALQMSYDEIKAAIGNPETRPHMDELMRNRKFVTYMSQLIVEHNKVLEDRTAQVEKEANRPSTAQLAEEAQQMAAEGETPIEPVIEESQTPVPTPVPPVSTTVDYVAEDAAWKAVGITVFRNVEGKVTRAYFEHQVLEEDEKTPIGRTTHLEAGSIFDSVSKLRAAYVLAVRAFARLKRQKLTFQQSQKLALTIEQIKAAAVQALEAKDPEKMEEAIRATIETKYADRETEMAKNANALIHASIQVEFMRRHLADFYPCEANSKLLKEYLAEHSLEFTIDNLEVAFVDLMDEGKLVKVSQSTPSTKPAEPAPNVSVTEAEVQVVKVAQAAANPAPATQQPTAAATETPAVAQASAQVTSTPVNEATVTTPAAAANPAIPAARRPGVNGGLVPGSSSAARPAAQDPALARKEFMKGIKAMDSKVMAQKLKTDPQFVKQCRAYGIQV